MSSPNNHNLIRSRLLSFAAEDLLECSTLQRYTAGQEVVRTRLVLLRDDVREETGVHLRQQSYSRTEEQKGFEVNTFYESSTTTMETALYAKATEEAEISLGTYESRPISVLELPFVLDERIREHWQSYEEIRSSPQFEDFKDKIQWTTDDAQLELDSNARVALPYLHSLGRMLKVATFKQTESPPRRLEGILNSSSVPTETTGSTTDGDYASCFRKRPRKKTSKKSKKMYRNRYNTVDESNIEVNQKLDWMVHSLMDIERQWELKDQQKVSEQMSEASTKVGLSDYQPSVESISPDRKLSGLTNAFPQ